MGEYKGFASIEACSLYGLPVEGMLEEVRYGLEVWLDLLETRHNLEHVTGDIVKDMKAIWYPKDASHI